MFRRASITDSTMVGGRSLELLLRRSMTILIHYCLGHVHTYLRRCIFVSILVFGLLYLRLQCLVLLCKLLLVLESLHIRLVAKGTLRRYRQAFLNRRSSTDALPPCLDVRKVVQFDTGEPQNVDPAVRRDVGDRVLVSHQVVGAFKSGIEDANETLRLSGVLISLSAPLMCHQSASTYIAACHKESSPWRTG